MKTLFDFFIQILRSISSLLVKVKRQHNELNRDHFSGRNDLSPIATKITNVLADQATVVERRTQIYYALGMKGGADFDKLDKDAGNDSWKFFHTLLLQYFSTHRDTREAIGELIACLVALKLELCASELERLNLTTCSVDIFWHNMDDVCQNFAGRKKELAKLGDNFHNQKRSTSCTVLTSVAGISGIGKTTLAREFAHQFRERYNGSVAWIPAENSSLVSNEFSRIANKLNLPVVSPTRDFAKSIYESLLSKNDNVLFIFDNFDDPNTEWIQDFLPNGLLAGKRPFVLITSRRRDITFPSNEIPLDALSSEEALQMIQKVFPNVSSEVGKKLAETLECYPLSIQIAISEIRYLISLTSLSQDEAIEVYIKIINRNYAILLDKNENVTLDYNKPGKNLQKQNENGLRKLIVALLIVLVAVLLTYSLENLKVDDKLQESFTKSRDWDSKVLETTEEFVRLKDELQQCFNILDINMGDFESDFKYFLDNVQLKSTSKVSLPVVEKVNDVPRIIKNHKRLENVMSILKPGWIQLYKGLL